jgi:hypothetical protein
LFDCRQQIVDVDMAEHGLKELKPETAANDGRRQDLPP